MLFWHSWGNRGGPSACPYISEGDIVEARGAVALCRGPARQPSLFQPVPAPSGPQRHDEQGQEQPEHQLRHETARGFLCRGRRCSGSTLQPQPGTPGSSGFTFHSPNCPLPSLPVPPHLPLDPRGWSGSPPRRCTRCHPVPPSPPSATSAW